MVRYFDNDRPPANHLAALGKTMSRHQDSANESTAIRVECYAGYRADENPRRFFIGKREVNVTEIIDRWLEPTYGYFKVRGEDGGIYILRHDLNNETWEMTLFDSGTRDETRLSST
jgi:hypothetical protein